MKIMVPLDTSDLSASALPRAAELARALGKEVLLVTVAGPSLRAALADFAEAEGEDPVDIMESNLRGAARSMSDLEVTTDVLSGEDAASSLLARAERGDVDMIIIASHGRTGVQRWMMGSVSERVVRGSTVPVMVIPAPWRTTPSKSTPTQG
ncbi:MAG: universal stress protein [Acidimicrobiia bacterium]